MKTIAFAIGALGLALLGQEYGSWWCNAGACIMFLYLVNNV